MASEHLFVLAVFMMYGVLFMFYTMSNGAIVGLLNANMLVDIPTEPSTDNPIDYFLSSGLYLIQTLVSFFFVMLINPYSSVVWLIPINWAILGATVYLFIRILRGGG